MHPIRLTKARTHNLKGVDLTLAPGELVALVGPSGAGKSSLAMATLYAEGQRRFVESFSAYARQFLERLPRPDVDELDPVPAAIAVDRQGSVRTSRSTVGSLTDVVDYAKNLWAQLAELHCPTRGELIVARDPETAARELLRDHPGERALVLSREPVTDTDAFVGLRERLVEGGYRRVQLGGEVVDLDTVRPSDVLGRRRKKLPTADPAPAPCVEQPALPALEVVVDRLVLAPRDRTRLVEALEVAFERGGGLATVQLAGSGERRELARHLRCASCRQRFAEPVPGLFSFNSAVGACETCRGFGRVMAIDWDKVLDAERSLASGGVAAWSGKSTAWERRMLKKHAPEVGVPLDVPVRELSPAQRAWLLDGDGRGWRQGWGGLRAWFRWMEGRTYKMHVRVFLARYRKYDECQDCGGTRYRPRARMWQLRGHDIAAFLALPVRAALELLRELEPEVEGDASARLLLRECESRLALLDEVGLGYLTLDRAANTLSGGELQRVALTSALGASLTGALFVLDEPTVGLHPRDVERLVGVVRRLSDAGNTVVVIEHDPQLIAQVDRVIELGPDAGEDGGRIVYEGPPAALAKAKTRTGRTLWAKQPHVPQPRELEGDAALVLEGATGHNLQDVALRVPCGRLTCVTGVSGSGKSSLISETLVPAVQRAHGKRGVRALAHRRLSGAKRVSAVVVVDQGPLVRTARGNPATYVGAWDVLRKRLAATPLAKQRGYKPGMFSLNVQGGRCEVCKGQGFETVEMQFLADVTFSCAACGGARFVGPVRDVSLAEHDVAQLLALTVDGALSLFEDDRELCKKLTPLADVGLGYLRLGQPLNTLSGGEAQRVKLAEALASTKPGALLVLDEPTAGLHASEIEPLLGVLRGLAARGDTVVVVEHDMRVAAQADHVVDLGPGAGLEGGRVVAAGPPAEVAQSPGSATAPYLAGQLQGRASTPQVPVRKPRGATRLPELLCVRGASEHNLKQVNVDIPRGQLVVVTGPSGSGKSSLAFGVIYAEGQRRYMETLSPYARQYLPQLPRPAVDRVQGVPPTLSLEQRLSRAGANSTVATLTEVAHYLRLLYARLGQAQDGLEAHAGALHGPAELAARLRKEHGRRAHIRVYAPVVRARKGLHRDLLDKAQADGFREARIDGEEVTLKQGMSLERFKDHDVDLLVAKLKTGDAELEAALSQAAGRAQGHVRVKVRGKLRLLELEETAGARRASQFDPRLFSFNTRQGACPACEGRGQVLATVGRGKHKREQVRPCGECGGTRLSALARGVLLFGKPITEYLSLDVEQAREALAALSLASGLEQQVGGPLLAELETRLAFLQRVGVGYLSLDRAADTLSGGEMQRVRLAAQLGSGLTGVLYVLDEPTIGLHPHDTERLLGALRGLVERGNSVLVVEHDTEVIEAADHVIDMGPTGGHGGGRLVVEGPPAAIARHPESATGRALTETSGPPFRPRPGRASEWLRLAGACENNLRDVDIRIPLGAMTAVTGVSGSGKSTLVREVLLRAVRRELGLTADPPGGYAKLEGAAALKRAVEVDQTPIGRTPRSVPATYVGIWDPIRKLLAGTPEARTRGFTASRFSFNVAEGRCPLCDGNGALNVEMSFLPDALVPCDACGGRRFSPQTLEVKLFGRNAGQLLDLEVAEAVEVFAAIEQVRRPLTLLDALGLGYLKLGQPSNTLSGGEAQRLKLVAELSTGAGGPSLYVLDEPTTGLHRADVERLLRLLGSFVERGDTLVVIEHQTDVMRAADWLIDLGPGGGRAGGRVVDMGAPAEVARRGKGHTGRVLAGTSVPQASRRADA